MSCRSDTKHVVETMVQMFSLSKKSARYLTKLGDNLSWKYLYSNQKLFSNASSEHQRLYLCILYLQTTNHLDGAEEEYDLASLLRTASTESIATFEQKYSSYQPRNIDLRDIFRKMNFNESDWCSIHFNNGLTTIDDLLDNERCLQTASIKGCNHTTQLMLNIVLEYYYHIDKDIDTMEAFTKKDLDDYMKQSYHPAIYQMMKSSEKFSRISENK